MANALQFIFHLLAASNFGFGIYYDIWVLEFPAEYKAGMVEFAGRWKYLTFWDMVSSFCCITMLYVYNYLCFLQTGFAVCVLYTLCCK